MDFISIDPGKWHVAWGLFKEDELKKCGLSRHIGGNHDAGIRDMVYQIRKDSGEFTSVQIVVEVPRVYPQSRKERPNDLIDLTVVAGACALLGPIEVVYPHQWKGNLPKNVSALRTQERLSPEELRVLTAGLEGVPRNLQHNIMDAVGIGVDKRREDR